MQAMIRLIIADDHTYVREVTLSKLDNQPNIEVIGQARRGEDALQLIQRLSPDIALLDIELEGMNGLEVAKVIQDQDLNTQVIILTGFPSPQNIRIALELKQVVRGFLSKSAPTDELITCIDQVVCGGNFVSPSLWETIQQANQQSPSLFKQLTPTEIVVLKKTTEEKDAQCIAIEMGIAKKTVDAHRANIREKLGLRNTGESLLVHALKNKTAIEQLS